MEKNDCFWKGGALYLYNVQNCTIKSSNFNQNSVHLNTELILQKRNVNYNLTYGGAIFY